MVEELLRLGLVIPALNAAAEEARDRGRKALLTFDPTDRPPEAVRAAFTGAVDVVIAQLQEIKAWVSGTPA